jgi:hypothetical protein
LAGTLFARCVVLIVCAAVAIASSTAHGRAASLAVSAKTSSGAQASVSGVVQTGFEATSTTNRYLAWRVRASQWGNIAIAYTGVTDGVFTTSFWGIPGGGWTGGGGGTNQALQWKFAGRPFFESVDAGGSQGPGYPPDPPGDYIVVALIAGGAAHAGLMRVTVTPPPGSTVEGFTSGPAVNLTDVAFATASEPVFIPKAGDSFTGSVTVPVKSALFGAFLAINRSAVISYTDPDENTIADTCSCGFDWFAGVPGTYILHLNEVSYDPNFPVVAIFADVVLP